jgi:hypothetical protein
MVELAWKYRLPTKSTPEDLASSWRTVLKYGDRILLAGYWHNPDGKSWFAAVYEFLDDNATDAEDMIGLRWVGEERFEDEGHAIAWAMQNA